MSAGRASRERGPRGGPEATASVLLVRALVMGAAALGLSSEQLAEGTGASAHLFTLDALGDPDARVPASLVLALWTYLPTRCPDESFGIWLSERLNAPPLSLASWLISSSSTLGEGLERALRYQRLLHDEAESELRVSANEASYRHQIGAPPFRAPAAAIEFGFITFLQLARRMTGVTVVPSRMRLRHAAPRDASRHRAWFGPALEFSASEDELVLDRADLDRKVLDADPALAKILEAHAMAALARLPESSELRARVRAQIHELLRGGTPSLEAVCERLKLSRRTLQRHLSSGGTSFAEELDGARHALALRYLSDPRISLQEAAFLLGFSDVTAFHRAFQRWTGQTPSRFRTPPE
jgi:AraC-like DNA-binding protein